MLKAWQCDRKIEKELHRMYNKNRVRGEWFKFDFGELCEIDNKITQMIEKEITI
ncbi:GIY-YIG nuclease family protein [Flavobacterium sp. UBA6046]|uniref:GIY-YIG nuclease family protein n=1 Tax=Flavobacterium sp. UBA6046 TaxID=1946552 RepID=UPI0039C85B05